MSEQTNQIFEKFQTMLRNDLSTLEFWQKLDQTIDSGEPRAVDELIAEIPESITDPADLEQLREFALNTLEVCRKKKLLLENLQNELKELDGI